MNRFNRYSSLLAMSASLLSASFLNIATASPLSDARELARGAIEDVTPQQKYRTAIREAGGAYKESLRDCAQLIGDEQRLCRRDAKATYDRDMADAKLILQSQN